MKTFLMCMVFLNVLAVALNLYVALNGGDWPQWFFIGLNTSTAIFLFYCWRTE